MKKSSFVFHWIVLTVLLGPLPGLAIVLPTDRVPEFQSGELIIKYKKDVQPELLQKEAERQVTQTSEISSLKQGLFAQQNIQSSRENQQLGIMKIKLDEKGSEETVAARLRQSHLIEWVEPNYKRMIFAPLSTGPNDTIYQNGVSLSAGEYHNGGHVSQWWMEAISADRAFAENIVSEGQQVIVAIIDSGIRLTHEDLSSKLVAGYNFINNTTNATDDNGHGTHVAGLVAAVTNNSVGLAGTGYLNSIKLMPVKVMNHNGEGTDFMIATGVQWAADNGAKVINMSLGGPTKSSTITEAVNYAYQKGCVVVASAGNYGKQSYPGGYGVNPVMYPASSEHVISVAACTKSNTRSSYSEYNQYVDIAAPGGELVGSVTSTPPEELIISTYHESDNDYEALSGTSMASPIVAGVAAMLLVQDSTRSPDQVESLLTSTADKIDSLQNDSDGYNVYLGWGQVNLYRALMQQSTIKTKSSGKKSYNYPNPFNPDQVQTHIIIPKDGEQGKLRIFDATGFLVTTLERSGADIWQGGIFSWDGKNGNGNTVANGVYPYVLEIDGTVYSNKIVVLR